MSYLQFNYGKMFPHFKTLAASWVLLFTILAVASGVELTFELPDNARQCFYEVIEKGTESTVEFQVSTAVPAQKADIFQGNLSFVNQS